MTKRKAKARERRRRMIRRVKARIRRILKRKNEWLINYMKII